MPSLAATAGRAALGEKQGRNAELRPRGEGATDYRSGLVTALANPQAILFFATIFVTMFPRPSPGLLSLVLLLVGAITIGWYAIVTQFLTAPTARASYQRLRPVIDAIFGIVLIAAAVRLASA